MDDAPLPRPTPGNIASPRNTNASVGFVELMSCDCPRDFGVFHTNQGGVSLTTISILNQSSGVTSTPFENQSLGFQQAIAKTGDLITVNATVFNDRPNNLEFDLVFLGPDYVAFHTQRLSAGSISRRIGSMTFEMPDSDVAFSVQVQVDGAAVARPTPLITVRLG